MFDREYCTERVEFWLEVEGYSKQHWAFMAMESYKKAEANRDEAVDLLSDALKSFHYTFRDGVVKKGNVLHDFISTALECVDWNHVAESRFDSLLASFKEDSSQDK